MEHTRLTESNSTILKFTYHLIRKDGVKSPMTVKNSGWGIPSLHLTILYFSSSVASSYSLITDMEWIRELW
jgi:hypothetical protein